MEQITSAWACIARLRASAPAGSLVAWGVTPIARCLRRWAADWRVAPEGSDRRVRQRPEEPTPVCVITRSEERSSRIPAKLQHALLASYPVRTRLSGQRRLSLPFHSPSAGGGP